MTLDFVSSLVKVNADCSNIDDSFGTSLSLRYSEVLARAILNDFHHRVELDSSQRLHTNAVQPLMVPITATEIAKSLSAVHFMIKQLLSPSRVRSQNTPF
jgi:hypothetical protein